MNGDQNSDRPERGDRMERYRAQLRVCAACGPVSVVREGEPTGTWHCGTCGCDLAVFEYVPSTDDSGAVGSLDEIERMLLGPFSENDHVPGNIEDAIEMIGALRRRLGGR